MEKKFIKISIFISFFTSLFYLVFILLQNYNSPENIEKRCTEKFQEDLKKGAGKSDEEWGIYFDKANLQYFKCMKIP